jgi:hypothetical protein
MPTDPDGPPSFQRLDFLYTPSNDVAGDMGYFRDVLGGRVVFAVEGTGRRVAAIELAPDSPLILLADHLDGDRPVMVFRVEDLAATMARLEEVGWVSGHTLEIPHGPVCTFRSPSGHRVAIYELTRPEAAAHFNGRFDF